MKTGLQCTSSPRRLSVQAISSKAERMMDEVPFLAMAFRMRLIFSVHDAPVRVSSRMKTGVFGKLGRSSHKWSMMSSVMVMRDNPFLRSSFWRDCASWWELTHPSMPTWSPFFKMLPNHSEMDGVSGSLSLKRRMPVPANCSSAWMK